MRHTRQHKASCLHVTNVTGLVSRYERNRLVTSTGFMSWPGLTSMSWCHERAELVWSHVMHLRREHQATCLGDMCYERRLVSWCHDWSWCYERRAELAWSHVMHRRHQASCLGVQPMRQRRKHQASCLGDRSRPGLTSCVTHVSTRLHVFMLRT